MAEAKKIDVSEVSKADSMEFADAVYHAAICYVKAGIPVLPLEPNEKKLPGEGGINYMSATTKEATVKKWFGPEGKYRGFNIGIGCGTKNGVMALDIDAKPVSGTTGLKELAKILEKEGDLPNGPRQKTPSGGFHYIYRWQDNAASSSNKVANGIDTRGGTADRCTGHIVAYPSKVNGKSYAWEEGGEVPDMPEWLSVSLGQPWKEKPKEAAQKQEVPIHQINRMLTVVDPDNLSYEDWVKVGMALKSTCGEDGLEIWDEWSRHGSRRKSGECTVRWKTFNEDGSVGFGTLSFLAKEAGWRPLPGDVQGSNISAEIEEKVLQFNKECALVRMGKSVVIATFHKKHGVEFLGMQGFYDLNLPKKVLVPTKNGIAERQLADLWMAHEQRREYRNIGVYPNNDQDQDTLNMWTGWGEEPDESKSCELYLRHIKDIICSGNADLANWVLDWMADAVQDPRDIKGTCIILRGVEGCGKGAFADNFGKLFGKHYTHLIDSERLTARFNSFLDSNIIVYADEVLWPGDRKAANVLKGLVSEKRITIEQKGIDSITIDNMNRVIIASNESWIVPAGPQSRRWLVLNVSPAVAKNKVYFGKLFEEINNGGMAGLLAMLMKRKITSDLRTAPVTKGLIEQRQMSHGHDSLLHFMSEVCLKGGFQSIDCDAKMGEDLRWPITLASFDLYSEYVNWCKERSVSSFDRQSLTVFMHNVEGYGFKIDGRRASVPEEDKLQQEVKKRQGIEQHWH